jgi:hypothetical protein
MLIDWFRAFLASLETPRYRRWNIVARGWPPELATRTFWLDYLAVRGPGEGYPGLRNVRLMLPVSTRYDLTIDLDESQANIDLGLMPVDAEDPVKLAWWDTGHWTPDLLRWDELIAICQALSSKSDYFEYPGIPLLLLSRFAPVTDEDDLSQIRSLATSAFETMALFDDGHIERILDRLLRERDDDVRWTGPPGAYKLVGDTVQSARDPEAPGFPYADFNRMLEDVRLGVDAPE